MNVMVAPSLRWRQFYRFTLRARGAEGDGGSAIRTPAALAATPGIDVAATGDVSTATWDVRDCGAEGDDIAIDTLPIQKAIDDCSSKGGGIVVFPAGSCLIGTIYLKSNVTLNVEAQTEIVGTTHLGEYGSDTGILPIILRT